MVKLFMFSPVSGLYSCPLAMTDGAAKTIQVRIQKKLLFSTFQHSFSAVSPSPLIRGLQQSSLKGSRQSEFHVVNKLNPQLSNISIT